MASGGERKCLALDHYFRVLKINVDKAKNHLDQLMETGVGRALALKSLPPKEYEEQYPHDKGFVSEALSMMKLVNDLLEDFLKRYPLETSGLLQDLDVENLLHPGDFTTVEEPSQLCQGIPTQIGSLSMATSESNVLPVYDVNNTIFSTSAEELAVANLYVPSTFHSIAAPVDLGVSRNDSLIVNYPNYSCSLTTSINAPIPSLIPMRGCFPQSKFLVSASHDYVSAISLLSSLSDVNFCSEGPTVEVRCEAPDAKNTSPVHKEIFPDISESIIDSHAVQRNDLSGTQEGMESKEVGGPCEPEACCSDVPHSFSCFDIKNSSSVEILKVNDSDIRVVSSHDRMLIPDDLLLSHSEVSQVKAKSYFCEDNNEKKIFDIEKEHNKVNVRREFLSGNAEFTNGKSAGCSRKVDDKGNPKNTVAVEKKDAASGLGFKSVESEFSHENNESEHKPEKETTEQCGAEEEAKKSYSHIQNEHCYTMMGHENGNGKVKNIEGSSANRSKTQGLVEKVLLNKPKSVYLSYFKPPDCLWLQLASCNILNLQDDLSNSLQDGMVPLEELTTGLLVAARYKVDGFFYRGVITECLEGAQEAKVLFIDYGNLENVEKADLSALPDHLKNAPAMALSCILTHFDDIELKTASEEYRAAVLMEIKSHIVNADPMQVIFTKILGMDENQMHSSLINYSRYCVRVLSGNMAFERKTNFTEQSGKPKEAKKSESTPRKRRTKSAVKLDHSNMELETSEQSKSADAGWTPLSEDEMKESYMTNASLPLWSALANKSISSTVYTVDADRHMSKSKKHGNTGFSKHVWDSSDDVVLNTQAVMSEGSEDSETLIPAYALPSVHLIKTSVPINGCTVIPAVLSHVENPHLFYLRILDSESSSLTNFQKSMLDYYKANADSIKAKELPVGSYWAVNSQDGSWKRAVVLANKLRLSGKKRPSQPEVEVCYVDFGNRETVPITRVRVLHENFTAMQILAIPCSLFGVYPVSECEEYVWSAASIEAFIRKCGGLLSTLFAEFSAPSLNEVYPVVLKNLETEHINKFLVASGYAKLSSSSRFSNTTPKKADGNAMEEVQPVENTINWNPMAEDFLAEGNIHVNNECAETVLSGIKNTDEIRLCKFFREGKKCPREACQWEHVRYRDGVTTERQPVFYMSADNYELPKVGKALAALVTNVVSPSQFYVYFPHGIRDLRELSDDPNNVADQENLDNLVEAMQKHYKYSLPEPIACLPGVGELKIIHSIRDGKEEFCRVRVLEIQRETDETTILKVFLIDYGEVLWVKEHQFRPIMPQFSHLPPQAVECYLEDLVKPEKGWDDIATSHLKRMTEKIDLVAIVKSIDETMPRLGLSLYNTSGNTDININEVLRAKMSS